MEAEEILTTEEVLVEATYTGNGVVEGQMLPNDHQTQVPPEEVRSALLTLVKILEQSQKGRLFRLRMRLQPDGKFDLQNNFIPMMERFDWAPDLTDKDILTWEEKENIRYPEEYKAFLLAFNGSRQINPNEFGIENEVLYAHLPSEQQKARMECFYALSGGESTKAYYTVERNKRYTNKRLPTGFVPVGRDEADNEICLCVSEGSDYGRVYYWDHEFEKDQPTRENMTKVGDSFLGFFGKFEVVVKRHRG